MEDDTTENIEKWVIDIHRQLNERKSNQSRSPRTSTIFKVPPSLRDVQESAFVPKIISIGPYHSRIDTMYEHKVQCLLHVLEGRSGGINRSPERGKEPRSAESDSEKKPRSPESDREEEPQSSESDCERRSAETDREKEPRSTESDREKEPRSSESDCDREKGPQSSREIKRSSESDREKEPQSSESDRKMGPQSSRSSESDGEMENQPCKSVRLHDLIEAIQGSEQETRDCYSHLPEVSSSDFVRMMVTDGLFLIELLRLHNKHLRDQEEIQGEAPDTKYGCGGFFSSCLGGICYIWKLKSCARRWRRWRCRLCAPPPLPWCATPISLLCAPSPPPPCAPPPPPPLIWHPNVESPIRTTRWLLPSLQCDIIKLENQIPYFILEKLFSLTSSENELTLQELLTDFFRSMWSIKRFKDLGNSISGNFVHPLDHLRSFFVPSVPWEHRRHHKLIYSAQELQEAGVSFSSNTDKLLNIKFSEGVLGIPQLSIDETTTTMLLNFVAYEQWDKSLLPFFINYLLFLDSLINTTKDVEILRKNEILEYPLGTEKEVVELFNNFCKEIVYGFDQKYLSVDMDAVNNYRKTFQDSKCRFWLSNLKKEKFSSPWTSLSLLAAIILLTLTMLQTFYTVFPYYHPN